MISMNKTYSPNEEELKIKTKEIILNYLQLPNIHSILNSPETYTSLFGSKNMNSSSFHFLC